MMMPRKRTGARLQRCLLNAASAEYVFNPQWPGHNDHECMDCADVMDFDARHPSSRVDLAMMLTRATLSRCGLVIRWTSDGHVSCQRG